MRKTSLGIRGRFVLTIAAIMIIFVTAGLFYLWNQKNTLNARILKNTAADIQKTFNSALNAQKNIWLTNALQLANNPIIQKAMHERNRQECMQVINQYNQMYKKHSDFKRIQIALIDLELKTFLKSWAENEYGDDLSYSQGLQAVRKTRIPLVTLEAARMGLRLKGLFPIFYQHQMVGIVNFEGGLNSIRAGIEPRNIFFLYFLNNDYLRIAEEIRENPRLGNYTLSIKEINQEFLKYVIKHFSSETAQADYWMDDHYLTVVTPALSFSGSETGLFLMGRKTDDVTADIRYQRKTIYTIFGLAALAMIGMVIILYWNIHRNVLRPLGAEPHEISEIIARVSQGDTQISIEDYKSSHRGIYAAIHDMIGALSRKADLADCVAQGDLSHQIQLASDKDRLGKALSRMVENLSLIVNDLRKSSAQVHSGAIQISDVAQGLSQGATESASSLEEISASMNEINAQVRHNAESAQEANRLTANAQASAQNGQQSMAIMAAAMAEIKTSSTHISNIIKTIDEIAFQTNLLALNAAVEAARAGKHGQGFAVVAQEVRNLAQRSAKAANETTELITASTAKVENGASVASQTAASLTEIVENITQAANIVSEIAAASNEQAQGLHQVSQGLGQIDMVIQQNTANAEECAAAAEELSGQSQQFRTLLTQFTLQTTPVSNTHPPSETSPVTPSAGAAKRWGNPMDRYEKLPATVPTPAAENNVIAPPKMIQWSSDFSVGVSKMDGEHQRLIDLINRLYAALKTGQAQSALSDILDELFDYTKTHFAAEEALLRLKRYPGLETQQHMHAHFVARISDMRDRFESGASLGVEALKFLKNWLLNHIQKVDAQYGPFLNDRGIS